MSRKNRIGRVQLGIKRAFIVAPDRAWSTSALIEWAFPLQLYRGRGSYRHRLNFPGRSAVLLTGFVFV